MKAEDMINDMRKVTIATGRVSSVQMDNLKKWAKVLFKNFKNINVKYNLDPNQYEEDPKTGKMKVKHDKDFWVRYEIFKKNKDDSVFETSEEETKKQLKQWIEYIFWNGVRIEIEVK